MWGLEAQLKEAREAKEKLRALKDAVTLEKIARWRYERGELTDDELDSATVKVIEEARKCCT